MTTGVAAAAQVANVATRTIGEHYNCCYSPFCYSKRRSHCNCSDYILLHIAGGQQAHCWDPQHCRADLPVLECAYD